MAYTLHADNARDNEIDKFHQMFELERPQFCTVTLLLKFQYLYNNIIEETYLRWVVLNSRKVPLVLMLLHNIGATCVQCLFMGIVGFVDSRYIKGPIAVKEQCILMPV